MVKGVSEWRGCAFILCFERKGVAFIPWGERVVWRYERGCDGHGDGDDMSLSLGNFALATILQ